MQTSSRRRSRYPALVLRWNGPSHCTGKPSAGLFITPHGKIGAGSPSEAWQPSAFLRKPLLPGCRPQSHVSMMEWCADVSMSSSSFFSLSLGSSFFWVPKQSVQSSALQKQQNISQTRCSVLRVSGFGGVTLYLCEPILLGWRLSLHLSPFHSTSHSVLAERKRAAGVRTNFTIWSDKELICTPESLFWQQKGWKYRYDNTMAPKPGPSLFLCVCLLVSGASVSLEKMTRAFPRTKTPAFIEKYNR